MKKILISVVTLLMTFGALVAQQYMFVWKTDGTCNTYHVSELDSVGFYMPDHIGGIGRFSVSDTQKVTFSRGNLQYQAATDKWRFAQQQWDYMGDANENISAAYSGWIDLFGWGTGDAPAKSSGSNSDYSSFADWDANPVSNGGNTSHQWRTLTKDEWVYLFDTRTDASSKYSVATVNVVMGVVLLPDEWNLPVSAISYSAEQWQVMEEEGAVFLPAAGYRDGNKVCNAGAYGCYWSSTPYDSDYAYGIFINTDNLNPKGSGSRSRKYSVRLVQNCTDEHE